ncbi:MAG: glucose-6-phosphate isomerase [Alphaproteobacteria bacterium]
MNNMAMLTQTPVWNRLSVERTRMSSLPLNALFAADLRRFEKFQARMPGLLLDYSKQWVDSGVMSALLALAEQQQLSQWRKRMFDGARINNTENRAVLHTALRRFTDAQLPVDGRDVMSDVNAVHARMTATVKAVRDGTWLGATGAKITDVVNIGIGGSDLGPRMVVAALQDYRATPRAHFVANVDADELQRVFAACDPAKTLFVIVSKTFTTQETMLNAATARAWLVDQLGEKAVAQHMLAVSTNLKATAAFGLPDTNVFGFWDWVGGRYSLWSSVGMVIALALGMETFDALRAGAAAMDDHFQKTPLTSNLPVLLALVGVWNRNFLPSTALAVLPYAERLRLFPGFLQQLDMESNGKSVARDGTALDYATGPVIFGTSGTVGQHSFYQLLHQGMDVIPAEFIGIVANDKDIPAHEEVLHAHLLAQPEALLRGRSPHELAENAADHTLLPHRVALGNRPSLTILLDKLDAYHLGLLTALYEHKVFVQGVIWNINSFDQWGVELGKQLAGGLYKDLRDTSKTQPRDCSTNGLLALLRRNG